VLRRNNFNFSDPFFLESLYVRVGVAFFCLIIFPWSYFSKLKFLNLESIVVPTILFLLFINIFFMNGIIKKIRKEEIKKW